MFGRMLRFFYEHFQSLKMRLLNFFEPKKVNWKSRNLLLKTRVSHDVKSINFATANGLEKSWYFKVFRSKVSILQPYYIRRGKRKGRDFIFEKGVLFHSFALFSNIFWWLQKTFGYERCSVKVRANMKWACRIIQSYSFFGFEIKARWQKCRRAFLRFHTYKNNISKIFAEFCNYLGLTVEICKKIRITIMKAICGTCFALRFCDKFWRKEEPYE